jgi:hypothetical protein
VPPGNYTLSAVASFVPGEVGVDDNRFVDGVVRIKPWVPPPAPPVGCVPPKWFLAFLFLLSVLLGANIVAFLGFILWKMKEERREVKTESFVNSFEESQYKATKKCNVCGKEFSAVCTFCPYYMNFHGRGW